MKRKVLNNSYSFFQTVSTSSNFLFFLFKAVIKKNENSLESTGKNHSKASFLSAMTSQIIFSTYQKTHFRTGFNKICMFQSTMYQYSQKLPLISECSSHVSETKFQEGIILMLFSGFATVTNTEKLGIGWVSGREFSSLTYLQHIRF